MTAICADIANDTTAFLYVHLLSGHDRLTQKGRHILLRQPLSLLQCFSYSPFFNPALIHNSGAVRQELIDLSGRALYSLKRHIMVHRVNDASKILVHVGLYEILAL